jgi:hypothetical protein
VFVLGNTVWKGEKVIPPSRLTEYALSATRLTHRYTTFSYPVVSSVVGSPTKIVEWSSSGVSPPSSLQRM